MRPGNRGSYLSELETYRQIRDANLDEELRISRLHGLVRDDNGIAYGLLLIYIDCQRRTLFCAASKPTIDASLLQSWFKQVEDVLMRLHGTVEGDLEGLGKIKDFLRAEQ